MAARRSVPCLWIPHHNLGAHGGHPYTLRSRISMNVVWTLNYFQSTRRWDKGDQSCFTLYALSANTRQSHCPVNHSVCEALMNAQPGGVFRRVRALRARPLTEFYVVDARELSATWFRDQLAALRHDEVICGFNPISSARPTDLVLIVCRTQHWETPT